MQVKDLEKRESRLKEVFKTQVSNFREACYCLFGYRVDMASQVPFHKSDFELIEGIGHMKRARCSQHPAEVLSESKCFTSIENAFAGSHTKPFLGHMRALGAGLQAMPSGSGRGMPPTTFVLKPQLADVPSAQLLFKMEAQGGMALLPNDYVLQHLSREAETFITRWS